MTPWSRRLPKAFKEFIPDSPFPAKTLVTALLSIVQLGINFTRIKGEVNKFAEEAIEYISALVEAAGEEPTEKGDLEDLRSKFAMGKEMFLSIRTQGGECLVRDVNWRQTGGGVLPAPAVRHECGEEEIEFVGKGFPGPPPGKSDVHIERVLRGPRQLRVEKRELVRHYCSKDSDGCPYGGQ
ncbi:hypothetical protein B0H14DRAFT_2639881 [Mycena olivaceomarginata]|nr:hypothetical protein B0H14DRAFT_2639881 [Mycena olivaceomarginata]